MGEVYRARDRGSSARSRSRSCRELATDAERLSRFEKEARSASALNHPNIVTIYEVGTLDGISFIAMELVEGKTLRELLRTGALPLRRLLPLAAQLADGLARAHEAGIVHRDLKPENVMVTKDGLVKILDFGLAKLTQSGEEAERREPVADDDEGDRARDDPGTVGYMSPEQATACRLDSGRISSPSVRSSTRWRRASRRSSGTKAVQTLSAIIDQEPERSGRSTPKLPANFCWIVERCLAKEPEGRYVSTQDLARDLARHSATTPRRSRLRRILFRSRLVGRRGGSASVEDPRRVGHRRGALVRGKPDRPEASSRGASPEFPPAHVSPRLHDRRPLRPRRTDDRVLGRDGTEAE